MQLAEKRGGDRQRFSKYGIELIALRDGFGEQRAARDARVAGREENFFDNRFGK